MNRRHEQAIDLWDELLFMARKAHVKRTGHTQVIVGDKTVECLQCDRNAHIVAYTGKLVVHDPIKREAGPISPEEF